jgi:hypothetical protein
MSSLSASSVKLLAMIAKRLTAGTLAQILSFDVVSFGARRVVVMNRLLNGMPWCLSGHYFSFGLKFYTQKYEIETA